MIHRGEIRWAELGEPRGSGPGYRSPVLVVQADPFNRSRLATVVVAAITANLDLAAAPGNVLLPAGASGLARDSVINVSQLLTLDRRFLGAVAGVLPADLAEKVDGGLRLVLAV